MPSLTRQFAFAFALLLSFVAAALTAQAWLQREARRLQAQTITVKRTQLKQALILSRRTAATWDAGFARDLGTLLDGTVTLLSGGPPTPPSDLQQSGFAFDCPFPNDPSHYIHVVFASPAANRLIALHERLLIAVILLALLVLIIAFVIFALPRRPGESDGSSRAPWTTTRAAMTGLEHFARMSLERGEALRRETGARQRAEEDLQLSRTMLDRSFEERAQLGRELHDNICQTLYAVSLTLESLQEKVAGGRAGEAGRRLDHCIGELRRLNREVRSYLKELEPTRQSQAFAVQLEDMLAAQFGPQATLLARNLDPAATALVPPERTSEVVNILREAISNSLRHSRPQKITVHAWLVEGSVVLAVQDNGIGFDPAASAGHGHGLANMQARAVALGGTLEVISAAGKGTRILLTLPVVSTV